MTFRDSALILSTSKRGVLALRNSTPVYAHPPAPASPNSSSTVGNAAFLRSLVSPHCTHRAQTPDTAPRSPAAAPKNAATRVAISQSHMPLPLTLHGMVASKALRVEAQP